MTEEIKTETKEEEIKQDVSRETDRLVNQDNVSRETYSDRLASIKLEKKEQEDLRTRADALEQTIIATTETREQIRSYLDKMDHPKKQEYFEILDDIKKSGYNVKDENAHTNFIATKLFLTANEVPKSLKRDFEIIESSNALTPANLESLEKIKAFTENAIEKKNKEATYVSLSNKFGENKNGIKEAMDIVKALSLFQKGKITREELVKIRDDFNDRTALKSKAFQ
ncbi:MAG: hypothetical protein GY928_06690 [Colwellia sp.]|nr:hypothetical protein [Colwellia sp.]